MDLHLFAAPLQGLTDYHFRNAYARYFGGIESYFAPYIRLDNDRQINSSTRRDLLPANNSCIPLIPQVMSRNADEMLYLASFLEEMGYTTMDWNLGCPYPMVAKRGLGSGMLQEPQRIAEVLRQVVQNTPLKVSVKMRLGYEHPDEILSILPLLSNLPLKYITIHPRIGKQLYKGEVNLDAFAACLELCPHPIVYNGDIHTYGQFQELSDRFPSVSRWMLGRGLLFNPFLPEMIRQKQAGLPPDWLCTFTTFHNQLLENYTQTLSGDSHLIQRMQSFWDYFSALFPHNKKELKRIIKARNRAEYHAGLALLFKAQ